MELFITLAIVFFLCWLGFRVTGTLLSMAVWLLLKLPIAVFVFSLGLILCATIFLIPLGLRCIKWSWAFLFD